MPKILKLLYLSLLTLLTTNQALAQDSVIGVWENDLTPIAPVDWNYDRAAHLLERAGFGGTPETIQKLANMSPRDAVTSFL